MSKRVPESFQPHVGLTSIFAADAGGAGGLPDESRLQPADAGVEAQLRVLLQAETFDALILEAVRPRAFDRAVLAPPVFHALREQVIARLTRLQSDAGGGEPAAEAQAAIAVLRARSREHELGQTFRYALLKG